LEDPTLLYLKNNKLFFLCIIALTVSGVTFISQQLKNSVVGTWISVDDPKSKWGFIDKTKAKTYYNNELLDTFTYDLSKSSPKCERNIETEINARPELSYLELTDTDNGDQYCYYVFGINEETLSLKPFNGAEILVYERQ